MVHFEQHEHIAVITLDRPEVRNAIDVADAERIEALIDSIEMDDSVWMSIITGTDTVICFSG